MKLLDVKLGQLPTWLAMRDFTPGGIGGALRRGERGAAVVAVCINVVYECINIVYGCINGIYVCINVACCYSRCSWWQAARAASQFLCC